MQKIFEALKKSYRAAIAPTRFFANESVSPASSSILRTAIFILVLTVPVLLSAIIRAVFYPATAAPVQRSPMLRGLTGATVEYNFPADVIIFVLGWTLFVLFASAVRFGFTRVLGEKTRSFAIVLFVTGFAVVPPVAFAALQRTIGNLLPLSLLADQPFFLHLRIILTFFVFAGAWLWEGLICMRGFKATLDQNRGRAILTWISPYAFGLFMIWFLTGWILNG